MSFISHLISSAASAALIASLAMPAAAQQAPATPQPATTQPAVSPPGPTTAPPGSAATVRTTPIDIPLTSYVSAGLARLMLTYLRMVADVRYGSLEPDAFRNGFTVRDLTFQTLAPDFKCRVTIKRLGVSGIPLLPSQLENSRIDASDIEIGNECFREAGMGVRLATNANTLSFSHFSLDAEADVASGAAMLNISAVSPEVARIEALASFDYLTFSSPMLEAAMAGELGEGSPEGEMPDESRPDDDGLPEDGLPDDGMTDEGSPEDGMTGEDTPANAYDSPQNLNGLRGELRAAHVTVEDLGAWDRVKPLLPPAAIDAAGIDAALVTGPEGTAQREFQQRIADGAKAFIAQPGQLTVMLRPSEPMAFNTKDITDAETGFAMFMPEVTTAPPTPPVALLAADQPTPEDPRALGIAFARGQGVPQNMRRAVELLTPLADDAEVALELAALTLGSDPAASYAHAQRAAVQGQAGALSALDRAESRLTSAAIFAAQPQAATDLPDTAFASVVAMRDMAIAYENGEGAPRSYALAARMALAAAAAGDLPAKAVLDRLDTRFGADPAWIAARDAAADQAQTDWTAQQLATRFAGQ